MPETWLVRVYHDRALVTFKECAGPVELGQQDKGAGEELFRIVALPGGGCRIAIAPTDEPAISRRHARVEEIGANRVSVRNMSEANNVGFEDGQTLRPSQERQADLPLVLKIGTRVVRIQRVTADEAGRVIRSLDEPTAAPGEDAAQDRARTPSLALAGPLEARWVFEWMRAMIAVLQSAAGDAEFFEMAARAVVENAGLDVGRVLCRQGEGWKTAAFHPATEGEYEQSNPPSRLVLDRVCAENKVSWLDPSELDEDCSSLAGVASVVAAPVRARTGEVIAILYGERRLQSLLAAGRPVSRMDAMLLEVLAVGLAAGLARVEQERAAMAMQTQFEQFFTPELARQLRGRPELLEGQDREITIVFCDIRGFSRISRKHSAATVLDWTNDVLSTLSDCVQKHQGALVDYIGDELMAMWGAPEEQPDHAERACRAALEMIAALLGVNDRWKEALGEPTAVGIGINTGIARVGNTGSQRKFKYGPLGDTVNVASRVQGACKYFKSSLLITRDTRTRLGSEFRARRLGNAYLVNISDPIELYELRGSGGLDADLAARGYEEALAAFEAGELQKAARVLGRLVNYHPDDGPSIALLARAMTGIVDEPENFDPAWRFKGK